MIKITITEGQYDQSPEEVIGQLKNNIDPVTKEFVDDVFKYVIGPTYMKRFGYTFDKNTSIYTKNET